VPESVFVIVFNAVILSLASPTCNDDDDDDGVSGELMVTLTVGKHQLVSMSAQQPVIQLEKYTTCATGCCVQKD
jgi:hypothetical protein